MNPIGDITGQLRRIGLHGEHGDEFNGAAEVYVGPTRTRLAVIFSNGLGWEHVSVSHRSRCPTWEEMCAVRALFWPADAWVIQFHPPTSEYVNHHPFCLHLWRPTEAAPPTPPSWMVGPRIGESLASVRVAEMLAWAEHDALGGHNPDGAPR